MKTLADILASIVAGIALLFVAHLLLWPLLTVKEVIGFYLLLRAAKI